MSSVMSTARPVNDRFLGPTAHCMTAGMVRRASQHRRADRRPGHPQRHRCLIWYLARSAMRPARPCRGPASTGRSKRLASRKTNKLRTYASLRQDATGCHCLERPGPRRSQYAQTAQPGRRDHLRPRPPVAGGDRERHSRPSGEGEGLLPDPGSSMPSEAVLVVALVVLVLLGAWLIAVFRTARRPVSGPAHPGRQGAAPAAGQPDDPRRGRGICGTRTRHPGPIRPRLTPGRPDHRLPAQPGSA